MRTLQEWMKYMEERKRGVRKSEAQAKQERRQATDSATGAKPKAAAESAMSAPASPQARHVIAPPASAGPGGAPPVAAPGFPGQSRVYGGGLARGVEQAREQMRRALRARQAGQGELPLGLPPTEAGRSSRRSADENRDELIERLLDPELTLQETAKLLNVCPTTVRRYTNRGVLNHFRTPGNQRRFRLSDVLEFMRRQQISRGQST